MVNSAREIDSDVTRRLVSSESWNTVSGGAADRAPEWTRERWGWIEIFAVIQLLWGVLLFIPGAQPFRTSVRALPYLVSLAALAYWMLRGHRQPLPASGAWLLAVFALLAANLLQATTHLAPGLAQVVLQISIAAPLFWAASMVSTTQRLERLLAIVFVASFASAAAGILQVYVPGWFLPPEFSGLARVLNPEFLGALSYIGPDGRSIIRPPGLSDLPGGAAVAGLTTVVLGIGYVSHAGSRRLVRLFGACAIAVGMTTLYLTQIRSLTVMAAIGVLIVAAIHLRQGRVALGGGIAAGGLTLVAASFLWALAIGGQAIAERFSSLIDSGLLATFQENRGIFLDYTFRELLFEFPLGAGLGRWGMMQVYFSDPAMWHAPPIHVEIQPTGWLLDGGVPMWVCYGGALAAAVRLAYRSAVHDAGDTQRQLAGMVLALQLSIIGLCLAGPVFNTQLGVIFWTITGALHGAMRSSPLDDDD